MSDSLSSVWGHSVNFANFLLQNFLSILRFFKGLLIPHFSFDFNQTFCKYVCHEGIKAVTFLVICQRWKFGTRGPMYCICKVLFIPDSLSWGWWSFGALSFLILRFSKGSCCHTFHFISTKLYCKYVGHEGIWVTFLAICQKLKMYI